LLLGQVILLIKVNTSRYGALQHDNINLVSSDLYGKIQ
jgi:hypothetical protein